MVIAPHGLDEERDARWHEDHVIARNNYKEAGITVVELL
jgi:hypothetical protein